MFKRVTFLAVTVACTIALGAPKVAPDVPKGGSNIDVIVRFVHPPTKDDLKLLGPYGLVKKNLDIINAVHISLSPQAIQALSSNPVIAYISPDRKNTGSLDITTQTVNANLAWQFGWDGTGVGVAVIDSGIAQKHDFTNKSNGVTSRVVYSQSFVAGQDASDLYGHGTHVAGIVGGSGLDSTGSTYARTFKGVAPNVNLVNLKVLDANGAGNESDVISAIQTAVALQSTYNIRVINLSLGRPVFESYTLDPLCQAVEAAYRAGIVVVAAAGNYGRDNSRGTKGYGTIASPGNDPYVITVGATNSKGTPSPFDDQIASFSAKGPTAVDHIAKPDIVAPGNGVVSVLASTTCTLYTQFKSTHVLNNFDLTSTSKYSDSYFMLSGTSMATPVVAGAAALLLQKTPSLTPDQVKERLMRTATKILPKYMSATDAYTFAVFTNSADIFTVGAGYLDINAALANTDLITVPAMSPGVIYNPTTHKVSLSTTFAQIIGMDDSVVWGDSMFTLSSTGSQVLWAADDSVVWGDSTNVAFSVIWSDAVTTSAPPVAMTDDDSDQ
jgi:serine protease AprX